MHIAITRGRLLAAGALFLALIALILGILVPPRASDAGAARDGDGPRLLISEFGHVESTIWLVNPDDPARRRRFLRVEHAPGWELAGAPAPHSDGLAYLVLPPGHYDARTQATLRFTTGNGVRSLATGLDLKGGVAWSADGEALYVRRWRGGPSGRETFELVAVDLAGGEEHTLLVRNDVAGLYPLGRPRNGPVYAVVIGLRGSELLAIGDGAARPLQLSSGLTRDWRLSPDGEHLAFTRQHGLRLEVRIAPLTSGAAADAVPAAVPAVIAPADGVPHDGTASPAWRPDGSLSVGVFGEPDGSPTLRVPASGDGATLETVRDRGFALPVAWSPAGTYLAVRSFSGVGPSDPGEETAAVIAPDGATLMIPGNFVCVLGWWHGDG